MRLSRLYCQSLKANLVTRMFQPVTVAPREESPSPPKPHLMSRSQKLMVDMGIIRPSINGMYHVLPLGMRAMNKLRNLVDSHMKKLGAQEISIPLLVDSALWKKSGRLDKAGNELFKLKDRHDKELILNPTHEESSAELMASIPQISHHQLPILLYQTSTKFRDEMRPRCGLIRSREFIMKDLYSFDESLERARQTYDKVTAAYYNIFHELQLEAIRVEADPGDIGGLESHEFHVSCDIGEETLRICSDCSHATSNLVDSCAVCQKTNIRKITSLEVGHTFLLGDLYTRPMGAVFNAKPSSESGKSQQQNLVMASYGIGLSRILAACIESMSTEHHISWPYAIAPYKIVIISAKEGSNEYATATKLMLEVYEALNQLPHLKDDIIIDDRNRLTIGKRVVHSQKTGYPYILVVGRKCLQDPPEFEIIEQAPNAAPFTHSLPLPELVDYFTRRVQGSTSKTEVEASA